MNLTTNLAMSTYLKKEESYLRVLCAKALDFFSDPKKSTFFINPLDKSTGL